MSVTKHARILNSPNLVSSLFTVHLYCKFVGCWLISRWRRKSYKQGLILSLFINLTWISCIIIESFSTSYFTSLYTNVTTRRAPPQTRSQSLLRRFWLERIASREGRTKIALPSLPRDLDIISPQSFVAFEGQISGDWGRVWLPLQITFVVDENTLYFY